MGPHYRVGFAFAGNINCGGIVTKSCLNFVTCSLPGSSVGGISRARTLEWVAISFSRGSSQPETEPGSPALQADSLPTELLWNPR